MQKLFKTILSSLLSLFIFAGGPLTVWADQNNPELNDLFDRLNAISDPRETWVTESKIWQIWIESDRVEVNTLMQKGILAMRRQ